jgi:hypothetical protein
MELARRHERMLLERLGKTVSPQKSSSQDREVQEMLAEAAGLGAELEGVQRSRAASLEQDRNDYPAASSWAKPAVIVRGLLARLVLHDNARRIRIKLRPLHRALGAASLDGQLPAENGATRPISADIAQAIELQRREFGAAQAERFRLLEPFGGRALPEWANVVLKECSALGSAFVKEARASLVPRLPGLAGLAAGWWVVRAFTASHWDRLMVVFGLRRGGPKVVSAETYERLQFWIPLFAAALCAYLCSRVSAFLRKRYSPQPVPDQPHP